jgi:hypothetical protein
MKNAFILVENFRNKRQVGRLDNNIQMLQGSEPIQMLRDKFPS